MQIVRTVYEDRHRRVVETLSNGDPVGVMEALDNYALNEARERDDIRQVLLIGDPDSRDTYAELIDWNGCAVVRYSQEWHTVLHNLENNRRIKLP